MKMTTVGVTTFKFVQISRLYVGANDSHNNDILQNDGRSFVGEREEHIL